MTPPAKGRNATHDPAAGVDLGSEVLPDLLDLHRHLTLDDVLVAMLERVAGWARPAAAFVYRPKEGLDVLAPFRAASPEHETWVHNLVDVDRTALEKLLGSEDEAVIDGLGAFVANAAEWPEPVPKRSVALAVRGDRPTLVAIVLLAGGEAIASDVRATIHAYLEGARVAVANALRVAAMKELIIKDDTANCFNRRHFEESLPEELSRSGRFRSPMSLIFFDLDNLKEVNSRHGHAMGSRTLYEVSVRVRSKVRKFDKLFRFGGDEFCILLPETEWHGALEVAERVRESIAGSNFLQGLVVDPEGIRITASFGIASFPLHARTREDIILQADRAMQRIKNGTKNSIAIAEIVGDAHES